MEEEEDEEEEEDDEEEEEDEEIRGLEETIYPSDCSIASETKSAIDGEMRNDVDNLSIDHGRVSSVKLQT